MIQAQLWDVYSQNLSKDHTEQCGKVTGHLSKDLLLTVQIMVKI